MSDLQFSHNTLQVLRAFASAIAELQEALTIIAENPKSHPYWDDQAARSAQAAVRAARMLTVKEEYR